MTARAAARLLVSALIRRLSEEGGHGTVLAKGDVIAGAILLVIADRGSTIALRERCMRPDGSYGLVPAGPAELTEAEHISDYLARRRRADPDLWIVELDGGAAIAVAEAILGTG